MHYRNGREAKNGDKVVSLAGYGSGPVNINAARMKSAAILTIKKPGALSAAGRKDIVAWLRKQAANLSKYGKNYNDTGSFTARYGYRE